MVGLSFRDKGPGLTFAVGWRSPDSRHLISDSESFGSPFLTHDRSGQTSSTGLLFGIKLGLAFNHFRKQGFLRKCSWRGEGRTGVGGYFWCLRVLPNQKSHVPTDWRETFICRQEVHPRVSALWGGYERASSVHNAWSKQTCLKTCFIQQTLSELLLCAQCSPRVSSYSLITIILY